VVPLEGESFVAKQARQALHALLQLVQALPGRLEGQAVRPVLLLVPPGANRYLAPAAGEVIDRGDGVGQHGRIAVAHRVHNTPTRAFLVTLARAACETTASKDPGPDELPTSG